MSELTEFLLARIAEDEAVARSVRPLAVTTLANGEEWPDIISHERIVTEGIEGRSAAQRDPQATAHYNRHDPARVLAECEAKRRYLTEVHGLASDGRCGACSDTYAVTPWDGLCEPRKYLALPYADHPDYRDEWRP